MLLLIGVVIVVIDKNGLKQSELFPNVTKSCEISVVIAVIDKNSLKLT